MGHKLGKLAKLGARFFRIFNFLPLNHHSSIQKVDGMLQVHTTVTGSYLLSLVYTHRQYRQHIAAIIQFTEEEEEGEGKTTQLRIFQTHL